jgi:hypothetical protein
LQTQNLIDAEIQHFNDNIGPDDLVNQTLRERMLLRANEVVAAFWDEHEWDFKYESNVAIALSAGVDNIAMPADFHTFGYEGGLWIPLQQHQILELRLQELLRRKRQTTQAVGRPEYFAIYNLDSTTRTPTVEFERVVDNAYTLAATYIRRPPLLVDRPAALAGVIQAGTTLGVGTYLYRVTFVTGEGETEGGLSFSITTTANNTNVALSAIPVAPSWAGVTSRKIYRSAVGDTNYRVLTTLADNTTTTFTDAVADAARGAILVTGTATYSGLELVPAEYHIPCIQEGMIVLDARDKGDMRSAAEHEARWRKTMARAWTNRQIGREQNMRLGDEGLIRFRMH